MFATLTRVNAESLLLVILLIDVALLLWPYYGSEDPNSNKYVILSSLLSALGIATKITLIPIGILFFFLISNNTKKIYFCLLTILFFTLISLPALFESYYFFDFIYRLLTKSGHYGSGESNIVNVNLLIQNLKHIFINEAIFSLSLIITIALLAYTIINKIKAFHLHQYLTGFSLVTFIYLFILGKHYVARYTIPLLVVVFSLLPIWIEALKERIIKNNIFTRTSFLTAIVAFFACVSINLYIQLLNYTDEVKRIVDDRKEVYNIVSSYKDVVKVYYYAASDPYYALSFGLGYTKKMTSIYSSYLKDIKKDSYEYNTWNQWIYRWREEAVDISTLLDKNIPIIFHGGTLPQDSITIKGPSNTSRIIKLQKIYSSTNNDEFIYKVIN
jgi:hypothetical protein